MKKSLTKNYVYNLLYQLLLIVLPLVTMPYVARILGVDGVGLYSYTYSMVTYFVLFGTVGSSIYAQREVAYTGHDREKRSYTFWEVVIIRCITAMLSMLVYWIIIVRQGNQPVIYMLQALNILAVMVDISWFFQGMEEFGRIVFINVMVKIVGVLSIFTFVNTADDLWVYVLVQGAVLVVGCMGLWIWMPTYLTKVSVVKLSFKRHIKGMLSLFVPQIAMSVYLVVDKTMIGLITKSNFENGYYEQAEKIVKLCLTVVTAFGTVMVPRMSSVFATGNKEKLKEYLYKAFRYVWFIGMPIMFGIIVLSDSIIPWFLGNGYEKVSLLTKVMSPIVIAIGLSNVIGTQYLVPTGRQKEYTLSVLMGAVSNVLINLFVISMLQSLGAVLSTVISEAIVTMVQFYYIKEIVDMKRVFQGFFHYLIAGICMLLILYWVGRNYPPTIINSAALVLAGIVVYLLVLFVEKDEMLLAIIEKIKC